ncbi:MAG: hypothetical protein Kow0031_16340 [Anaerolineae bacterium]
MSENVLLATGRELIRMPEEVWKQETLKAPEHVRPRLAFMTEAHHQVRYFVVRELPRYGRPIRPEEIGRALALPMARVDEILDDLERHLFFLWRNEHGAVEWAFPVTAASTAHHLTFSTGEHLDAA